MIILFFVINENIYIYFFGNKIVRIRETSTRRIYKNEIDNNYFNLLEFSVNEIHENKISIY